MTNKTENSKQETGTEVTLTAEARKALVNKLTVLAKKNNNSLTVDEINMAIPKNVVPGPDEIDEANQLKGKVVLDNNEPVNIKTLISLISNAKFIVANDTGPAHIASHLDKKGIVLFGSHTTAKRVSIENYNFKAISVKNLKDLEVDTVLNEIKVKLN